MWRRKQQMPANDHFEAQLRTAADIAISAARRAAPGGEQGVVLVEDVYGTLHEHFGQVAVPWETVAAMLRRRYEYRTCGLDLDTDAYGPDPTT